MKKGIVLMLLCVFILPLYLGNLTLGTNLTVSATTFYDFVASAGSAVWQSGAGTLPFPGSTSDERGFAVVLTNATMEDNSTYTKVLETHPEWKDKVGYISGTYPEITVPEKAKLELKLGFLKGATGTDGVRYRVFFGTAQPTLIFERNKKYINSLDSVTVDLSNYTGQKGKFTLYVSVYATSSQDWACWVDAKITTIGNPDLIITDLWVDSGRVVHYKIKNIGDAPSSTQTLAITNTFYVNNSVRATDVLSKILNAGEEHENYFKNYTYPAPQVNETLKVCADTGNAIKESNEQNNCREETEAPSFGGIQVNTGCPQVKVEILNEKRQVVKSGTSDSNSTYSTGLTLAPGNYIVTVSKEGCTFEPKERTTTVEANKSVSVNFTCSCKKGPDLVITQIECDYQKKIISFAIKNAGDEIVNKPFSISLSIDGIEKATQTVSVSLSPGGTHSSYFDGYITTCKDLKVKVVCDTKNEIIESNEGNNSFEKECECEENPDLIISKISVSGKKICYLVRNSGKKDMPSTVFYNSLSVDGRVVEEMKLTESLSSGGQTEKCFNYDIPAGNHNIRVCADSRNAVKEANENNNCLEQAVTIQEKLPDLLVESINCEGENFISFTAKNSGFDFPSASWASTGEVYFDGVKKGTVNLKNPSSITGGGIEKANGTSTYLTDWSILATTLVKVIVDNENTIKESNELNNTKESMIVQRVLRLPDLVITKIIVEGTSVYYKIKNIGEGTAGYRRVDAGSVVEKLTPCTALYVDGIKVSDHYLNLPLEPGQEVQGYFKYDLIVSAPYDTLKVCADWEDKIDETDENNNCTELIVPAESKLPEKPCGCFENNKFGIRLTPWDGFAVGNVMGGPEAEIIVAIDEDAPGNNGKYYIYNSNGDLLRTFEAWFTHYDRIITGDFCGDSYCEIAVIIDDDERGVYVYDSMGTLLYDFPARFTHYDVFASGNIVGDEKDEFVVAIDEDDKIYIYSSQGEKLLEYKTPFDFRGAPYFGKTESNDDAMAVGNVYGDSYNEVLLVDQDVDNSIVYILGFSEGNLKVLSTLRVRYTKYDVFTTGNVLGNEREEIIIGIDEDRMIYIYDAMTGLLKIRYANITPVDAIATGNISGGIMDEIILAVDDDKRVYIFSEEQ